MRVVQAASISVVLASIGACTPREELPPPSIAPSATTRTLPERSYLDPGPAQNTGGPRYLYDNMTSAPRQTDSYGNDLIQRIP
jgi:hypothetical protein